MQMKKMLMMILAGFVFLILPLPAAGMHVFDEAGILSETQLASLEDYAGNISERYQFGVYIVTLPSLSGGEVEEMADELYHERYGLGEGTDRNGILLLLSMEEREYALLTNGPKADYAFTSYGLDQLEAKFLDDLKEDQWASGFNDYLSECDRYLSLASENHPVKRPLWTGILLMFAISAGISLGVCLILKQRMKSVAMNRSAAAYCAGSLALRGQSDQFVNTTVSRRKIEKPSRNSDSSGTSHGSTVQSGKF